MPNSTSNINETFHIYSAKDSAESRNKSYLKYNLYFVWDYCITAAEGRNKSYKYIYKLFLPFGCSYTIVPYEI
jgi:hypothetical protein